MHYHSSIDITPLTGDPREDVGFGVDTAVIKKHNVQYISNQIHHTSIIIDNKLISTCLLLVLLLNIIQDMITCIGVNIIHLLSRKIYM